MAKQQEQQISLANCLDQSQLVAKDIQGQFRLMGILDPKLLLNRAFSLSMDVN